MTAKRLFTVKSVRLGDVAQWGFVLMRLVAMGLDGQSLARRTIGQKIERLALGQKSCRNVELAYTLVIHPQMLRLLVRRLHVSGAFGI